MSRPRVSGTVPVLLALLSLLCLSAAVTASAARKAFDGTHLELRPKFIRPCEGVRHNGLEAVVVDYEMRGRTTVVMMFNATVTRSADRWSKVRMAIEQCDQTQTVSSATCTPFRNIDFNDPCTMMMNPGMPWAKVVTDVQPKLTCPVAKGHYTLSNGTLSMDLLNAMSGTLRLEGYLWRFRSNCLDSRGDTHFCVDGAGEFFRVRNRPKG